jgi:hypothetical protein
LKHGGRRGGEEARKLLPDKHYHNDLAPPLVSLSSCLKLIFTYQYCITQLSIIITTTEICSLKGGKVYLGSQFWRFPSWFVGPVAFGPGRDSTSWREHVTEEAAHLMANRKQREREEE